MRLECAVLCDSSTFRESFLNILGAGVTGMEVRGDFPQPLNLSFAFRAVLESREQHPEHKLRLRLTDSHGERQLAQAEVTFLLKPEEEIVSGEAAAVAAAIPLGSFAVPGPGLYLIEANFDTQSVGTFPLRVTRSE